MRRATLFIITGGLVLAGAFASGARAAGADPPTSTPGTPSATPTVTPSPTPTRTARPKAVKLLRASLTAMATVRQVHSDGTLTDGFGAKHAVKLTADCDSQAQKVHILMQVRDSHGTPMSIEVIKVGADAWVRARSGSGAWTSWTALEGDAQYFLIFFLPQSCPQESIADFEKSGVPPHLKNLGPARVDGAPTWHLRAHTRSQGEPVVLNLHVDQTTYFWRRYAISQTAPKKKDTVIENTRYSRFNVPVDIEPPVVAPSRTQARAMSRRVLHAGVRDGFRSGQWMPLHWK